MQNRVIEIRGIKKFVAEGEVMNSNKRAEVAGTRLSLL